MGTFTPSAKALDRQWHIIDAKGQVLGRIASVAARLLQGKHKPTWAPFLDTGDHVIIVNAATVKLTGKKEEQKIYRRHSGYEGGLKEVRAKIIRAPVTRATNVARSPSAIAETSASGRASRTSS